MRVGVDGPVDPELAWVVGDESSVRVCGHREIMIAHRTADAKRIGTQGALSGAANRRAGQ
jgi:hypothetical protein